MAANTPAPQPNPGFIFESLNAYQRTAALKGAIELEIFTHIADGATSAAAIAERAQASVRGVRILCDYLTVEGFLTKEAGAYGLSQESAIFLNKRSPAYMGSIAFFVAHKNHLANFDDVAAMVRKGGTVNGTGNLTPDHEIWVEFAHYMMPMMWKPSAAVAEMLAEPARPMKVLDIAASHGLWGIAFAKRNPAAQIFALDWKNVLEAAIANAEKAGVADRFHTIPGSAFEVDLGSDYDIVLLPNFLHHFDPETCIVFLKRLRAAVKPGGMVVTPEMVPNEDRLSPPIPATFSLMMLGSTEAGDAYTFAEYDRMFRAAGFGSSTIQDAPFSAEQLILTQA